MSEISHARRSHSFNRSRAARRPRSKVVEAAPVRSTFEALEGRQMMAVDVLVSDGVLTVNGTEGADTIVISSNVSNPYTAATAWAVSVRNADGTYTTTTVANPAWVTRIVVNGRGGDDTIRISDWITHAAARVDGGLGNDYIAGGGGADSLFGGGGRDSVNGQGGNDLIDGGDGVGQDPAANTADDVLDGGAGNDRIYASRWGNSTLRGGNGGGSDSLYGGTGNDSLYGQGGADHAYGGGGLDVLWGGDGDDAMDGGAGNDFLYGDAGNDTVNGGDGNDVMYGGVGDDLMHGGLGNDDFNGEAGADSLYGSQGVDTLYGGGDNDRLDGGANADVAFGGDGIDTLCGVCGEDVLSGGAGNDVLEATFNLGTFFRNRGRGIAPANEYQNPANGTDTLSLKLDLGSVIREVIKPVVGKVQDVTRALDPIVKLYDTKVPVLSYFDSSLTYGKVIDPSGRFRALKNAVNSINSLTVVEQDGLIDYANFSVSGSGVHRLSLADPFQYVPDFRGTLNKLNDLGLSFPILNDTASAATVALGRNVDLFTYTLPSADFGFKKDWTQAVPGLGYTIPSWVPYYGGDSIGVSATIGVSGSFKAGGKIGVDMAGVHSGNLLDGFFATANTGASLTIGVSAKGSLNLGIASGWVGGSLDGSVSVLVRDTNRDGKSRLSEMSAGSTPFDASVTGRYSLEGRLKVNAVKVDYYFDSYTVWGGYDTGVHVFASGAFKL